METAGLEELYGTWRRHAPFDNCRKLIACRKAEPGPLPGNDPVDFFATWLQHGVGGPCWAIHGAWCELLQALGFNACRAVATMMLAPDLPPNHATVVVTIDGDRFLVDASIMFVEPLLNVQAREARVDHAHGVSRPLAGR